MRYLKLFLCLLVVSLTQPSMAMTPTPQQIEQFKKLPKSQQKALAKQYGIDINSANSGQSDNGSQQGVGISPKVLKEEQKEQESNKNKFLEEIAELKPFGYDLFSNESMLMTPDSFSSIPDSYLVGPGDEFQISIYGKENNVYNLLIDREGRLSIPNLSPVSLSGMNFLEAKKLLKAKIEQEVIGVNAFVTISNTRPIRVIVLGEVKKPGAYALSSLSSVTHALFNSGGITEIGSLRNIQVKRSGKQVAKLDLYKLITEGDSSGDVVLNSGDVVFVPAVKKRVTISGAVSRKGIYELAEGEGINDLVYYSGGFQASAVKNKILIERFLSDNKKIIHQLDENQIHANFSLHHGDEVKVPTSSELINEKITVVGAVSQPGFFPWQDSITLKDIFTDVSSDILPIADYDYSLIIREKNIEGDIEILPFSLKGFINGEKADLKLNPKDVILVFSRFERRMEEKLNLANLAFSEKEIERQIRTENWHRFQEKEFYESIGMYEKPAEEITEAEVSVSNLLRGEVEEAKLDESFSLFSRKRLLEPVLKRLNSQASALAQPSIIYVRGLVNVPGKYPLSEGGNVSSAIMAAGGLKAAALVDKVEVTRFITPTGNVANFSVSSDEFDSFELTERDIIQVFKSPSFEDNKVVSILGEVQFPGRYTIKSGETFDSIISRAGGLKHLADSNSMIFTREKVRINEKERLAKLSNDLRKEIASKGFSNDVNTPSLTYQETNQLLSDIENVKPLGRVVLDYDLVNTEGAFLLEDGDAIYIPPVNNTISVIGEVNVATTHLYSASQSVDAYINASGGLKQRADQDRIYIIKGNGSVIIPQENSWFAVNHEKNQLEPGDTIVVPLDTDYTNTLTLWSTATQMLYQIGLAAAAISAL